MKHWSWDNPRSFRDQVDRSNPQTIKSGKVKRTSERSSRHSSPDLRAKIEPPSCWQCKPGHLLAVGPPYWDEIIDQDDDDGNWADPGMPSGGWTCPGDGNDNDYGTGEADTEGCEKANG